MIEVTGMWVNYSKSGDMYLVGYMGNAKLVLFKNKFATENEKAPQWKLFVVENNKNSGSDQVVEDLE